MESEKIFEKFLKATIKANKKMNHAPTDGLKLKTNNTNCVRKTQITHEEEDINKVIEAIQE